MNTLDSEFGLHNEAPPTVQDKTTAESVHSARYRIPALRHHLATFPNSSPHWLELGCAYVDIDEPVQAEVAFRAALRIRPDLHVARAGLANILAQRGRYLEAVHECQEGLIIDPTNAQLHEALAESFMATGLPEKARDIVRPDESAWLSDTSLKSSLPPSPAYERRAIDRSASAHKDRHLPSSLHCSHAEAPSRWTRYLGSCKGLRIGLAWADDKPQADALLRSIPLLDFAPLGGLPGVTFFSLQNGNRAREIAQPPERLDCIPLSDAFSSRADCIEVLPQMDLVIAVDSDLAHAAAELGCRTWVLLPEPAYTGARHKKWEMCAYANVQLFRQRRRGHWEEVIHDVATALRGLVKNEVLHQLDDTERHLFAAETACAESRLAEAGDIYRKLLSGQYERSSRLLSAVRRYMECSNTYDFADVAAPPPNGSAGSLDRCADLAAWILARHGKHEAAWAIWKSLCDSGMPSLQVLMHYGDEAQRAHDWKRAIDIWEKAMMLYPEASLPPLRAAQCYRALGNTTMAVTCLRRGLALSPAQPNAHFILGQLLCEQSLQDEALSHAQLAVFLDPGHVDAWVLLGYLLYGRGLHRTAAVCFEHALTLNPSHYATLYLGYCAFNLKEYESAISWFDKALQFDPKHEDSLFFKARAMIFLEQYNDAANVLTAMRCMDPEAFDSNETYRKHLFIERLRQAHRGDADIPNDAYWSGRKLCGKRWSGESLQGKTLLVYQDAGFGDSIQSARYFSRLKQDCGAAKLMLAVWPELVRLYEPNPDIDEVQSVFAIDITHVECDFHIDEYSLLFQSLLAFGPAPSNAPYLKADPVLSTHWREKLADDRNVKVGLAWAGSALHPNDSNRSMSLSDLLPLAELPGISFYALQKGPALAQLRALPDFRVSSFDADIRDFADTAALMSCLDLVISVDSSPVHLAGALGVPVWVLIPGVQPDWRWDKEQHMSPWYPSIRLFHRAADEHWNDAVLRVRHELERLTGVVRCPSGPQ